jgi:gamma-glutamyltranspeptidase
MPRQAAPRDGWPWLNAAPGQDPYQSGFRPVLGERGMVATPHPLASQVGLDVIRRGGNAVDAAVAVSAVLMVVVPMQCSPGGDAFWVIAPCNARPSILDASGAAPIAADPDDLLMLGQKAIPTRSAWAVTVPGAVAGWESALARFGTRSLEELLRPAVRLAEEGFFVGRHLRASIAAAEPVLRSSLEGVNWYLRDGIPPLYSRLRQPALARTLRELGRTNSKSLYEGALSQAISDTVQSHGGWLAPEDLAAHTPRWEDPLSVEWRGLRVLQPPPPAQGTVLLAALTLADVHGDVPLKMNDGASHHAMIEALRAARADFEAHGGDPDRASTSPSALLGDAYLRQRASSIDLDQARRNWPPGLVSPRSPGLVSLDRDGDTAHLAVLDADGMAVSLTQSLFHDFGSGVPVAGWGFFLQNRGASFSLTAEAPNALAGGLQPPHTLVCSGHRVCIALGAMGGTGQPQTLFQLLARLHDEGLDPAEAIASPRWYSDATCRDASRVYVESRLPRRIVEGLQTRGHDVVRLGAWEELMGHAQVIIVDDGGALIGGADPRSDGAVATW